MNAKDIFDKVIDDALHDGTGMFRVTYIDPKETSQVAPLARAPASILAIDPGTLESGWVILEGRKVADSGVIENKQLLPLIANWTEALAIEMIASYGMPVGREVFETCVWIGRFVQVYRYSGLAQLIYRKDVKMHLCGTSQAKDQHIRQALIDLIGPQGVKKAPGPTYGVRSHAWAALGVAATALKLTHGEPL